MKGRYSKFVVVLVIVLNVLFAAAVLFVSYKGYTVPDSLIIAWFAFTTGELSLLASIKKKKVKKGGKQDESENAVTGK